MDLFLKMHNPLYFRYDYFDLISMGMFRDSKSLVLVIVLLTMVFGAVIFNFRETDYDISKISKAVGNRRGKQLQTGKYLSLIHI